MKIIPVKSANSDRKYRVYLFTNGNAKCTCPAYTFRKFEEYECKHIIEVKAKDQSSHPENPDSSK